MESTTDEEDQSNADIANPFGIPVYFVNVSYVVTAGSPCPLSTLYEYSVDVRFAPILDVSSLV